MKFIHAADLHLDSPLRGLEAKPGAPVSRLRGATRVAVRRLIDLCLSEQADLLLIAGDLFDGDWPDYSTGLFLIHELRRLVERGPRVVLLRGNHDAESRITRRLSWPQGVFECSTKKPESFRFEDLGAVVHGQGFAQSAVDQNLAESYPRAVSGLLNIGLLHTSLDGRPGHSPYAPTSVPELIAKGYDYWALGHVHTREIVCERPWIAFPGNPQGRHIRETGARGVLVVETNGQAIQTPPRFVALDTVRFEVVEFAGRPGEHPLTTLDRLAADLTQRSLAAREDDPERLLALRVRLALASSDLAHADAEELTAELDARLTRDQIWIESLKLIAGASAPGATGLAAWIEDLDGLLADKGWLSARTEELVQELNPKLQRALGAWAPRSDEPTASRMLPEDVLADVRALFRRTTGHETSAP